MATQIFNMGDIEEIRFSPNYPNYVTPDEVWLNDTIAGTNTKIWGKGEVLRVTESTKQSGNFVTIKFYTSKTWDGSLYARQKLVLLDQQGAPTNQFSWTAWQEVQPSDSITLGINPDYPGNSFIEMFEIYGVGNTGVCTNSSTSSKKLWSIQSSSGTPQIALSGNLFALLDANVSSISTVRQRAFQALFQGWSQLITAPPMSAPITLSNYALYRTFYQCTNLTDPSYINVNAMGNYSCREMFQGCTALITTPSLSATTLASSCYNSMFKQCTALVNISPSLTATTLASSCYSSMFYGCTSLTSAPSLPATTLASSCYSSMFSGCTALTSVPSLPATTLASSCYESMFQNCTSLTTAPSLPATSLTLSCYANMFKNCTSLASAPTLSSIALAEKCYQYMFQDCTALTTAPSLPATTLSPYGYQGMFQGCTALTTAPSLPATDLSTPYAVYCYESMFKGCTSLAVAPNLPATNLINFCYSNMFYGCTSLINVPYLPATTIKPQCYQNMFYGCINLETLPLFPTIYLDGYTNAMNFMFSGCSKIKLSTTQSGIYVNTFEISAPNGTPDTAGMFNDTGGDYTTTGSYHFPCNVTFYTSNNLISS